LLGEWAFSRGAGMSNLPLTNTFHMAKKKGIDKDFRNEIKITQQMLQESITVWLYS
jgi:hypothetical protein